MDMSPVHQVWPKPFCKAQWKREEDKADKKQNKNRWEDNIRDGQAQILPRLEGSGEHGKMEETGSEVIYGTPKTPMVKG